MTYPQVDRFDFSLLSKAFVVGLGDSVTPGNLALILILVIFLSVVGLTTKRIIFLGVLFIGVVSATQFLSVIGALDYLLSQAPVLSFTRVVYLLLTALFFFLGIGNILDWWRYKEHLNAECFRFPLPAFLKSNAGYAIGTRSRKEKIFAGIRAFLLTVVVAFIPALLAATFPQNEYVFVIHSFMMAGGDKVFVYLSFAFYGLAMILPVLVTWIIILWIVCRKKRNIRVVLYYKIIFSALLLSVGAGLGYFFLI